VAGGRTVQPASGNCLRVLITIVHRRAVDRVRATSAAARRDEVYQRRQPMVDHDPTMETAQARLGAAKVRAAMAGLSFEQQQVLELAYFDGLTHSEIAATLGIPLGTAKTRIRDGLIRLRRLLDSNRL
jgi:RNA polymerase sigma-70 factor, ECF subfamily